MTSPLEKLGGPGKPLRQEPPDAKEYTGLKHSGLIGLGPGVWRVLARCHDIRNRGEDEGDLEIDERLLAELIAATKTIVAALNKLPPP